MEIRKDLPIHYRYNDYAHESGLEIKVSKFFPVRETKCCYFVISEHDYISERDFIYPNPRVRKVLKGALRGHCHTSMDTALHSYKKRKEAQIRHNEFALAKAKQALTALSVIREGFNSLSAGRPAYWDQLVFE